MKLSDRLAGYYTVDEAAEALGYGRYSREIERLIAAGDLPVDKLGGARRWIRVEDVEAVLHRRAGVLDAAAAADEIASLRAQNDQLRANIRELDGSQLMAAEDALAILSLDEALDILGRLEAESESIADVRAIREARHRVQHQLDQRDAAAAIGRRPKGVPARALRRPVATGIGVVDLWVWRRQNGNWDASYGGPRGPWPGGRGHPTKRAALKAAAWHARYAYGKPDRRTSARLRFLILERDDFTCRYCGRKAPDVELHVDHAVSIADGGSDTEDNLVTACKDCNLGKAGRSVPVA